MAVVFRCADRRSRARERGATTVETANTREYLTSGGITVRRTDIPVDPAVKSKVLNDLVAAVGERRGGVLSSGVEYPGRYSRWHMAYIDPCLEIVARGRALTVTTLNERGR